MMPNIIQWTRTDSPGKNNDTKDNDLNDKNISNTQIVCTPLTNPFFFNTTMHDAFISKKNAGEPIWKLICDPHIAVCAGALAMSNVSLAFIEPTIAVWMKDKLKAGEIQHIDIRYAQILRAKTQKWQWHCQCVNMRKKTRYKTTGTFGCLERSAA